MKDKQEAQAFTLIERRDQLQDLRLVETDDFAEFKKRGLDLRPFMRMFQRNLLLISSIASLVATITIYFVLSSPRSYEGNFQILVEPVTSEAKLTDPSFISRNGEVNNNPKTDVNYPSLLRVLQGTEMLGRVVQKIQARYPDITYETFNQNLVVQRIGEDLLDSTNIIEVIYKDSDPEKVEFVLSEIAQEYLSFSLNDRKKRINAGVKFIDAQLPKLQQQVSTLEGNLQRLQQKYKLSDPESQVEELSQQVREVEAQKLNAQKDLQENKRLYERLQQQLRLTPDEALAASTLSQEPRYQELLGELKKLESVMAMEAARFSEEHPSFQKLRQQQQNLSQLLNQEAQNILGQKLPTQGVNPQLLNFQDPTRLALIKQLVDTTNNIQVLESRLGALAQSEAYLAQQVNQFPVNMRQYNELRRRLEIATKTLNQLSIQRETLQVDAAQREVPWEVVSPPRIPRDENGNLISTKSDNLKKLAMGLVAAGALGLGAAALKEKHSNVFYTSEDIENEIKLPVLEVIPWNENAQHSSEVIGAIDGTEEDTKFLSAFDSLYASVRFLAGAPKTQSLVVTSPAPGDGKSTIALHLAQAAAYMGKKALLVDANFRLPYLHTKLGLENVHGLSNMISEDLAPRPSNTQLSRIQNNLFVLTSGKILPSSTRMLGSTQMQHVMEQFHQAFDLVIYDTPHLLGFADSYFLAEHTDGILMVVGVGKTKRSLLTQALHRLRMLHLPVLGIVANNIETSKKSSSSFRNLLQAKSSAASSSL
ncbi:MAG: polysaccharide biosynthesis tyrosine autokinase [Fischerella sp.]|jgi:capsular exopolysaccharide synthesis family protein|uniref:GumC family protein n=1 Tax=Fischerella sp. TaxID=1191 RepID=UPI00183D7F00|nr:tyrosine-protein kinase domain-containing protein [Fischerella sp.]NWF58346.1 polysaccharide biosynthesis tyrosine autokinase [Fischerella sp.]